MPKVHAVISLVVAGFMASLSGCSDYSTVSSDEFKEYYAHTTAGPVASAHWYDYLGQKDGYSYLKYGRMNYVLPGSTNRIIRVKTSDLDPTFAGTLPAIELKEVPSPE